MQEGTPKPNPAAQRARLNELRKLAEQKKTAEQAAATSAASSTPSTPSLPEKPVEEPKIEEFFDQETGQNFKIGEEVIFFKRGHGEYRVTIKSFIKNEGGGILVEFTYYRDGKLCTEKEYSYKLDKNLKDLQQTKDKKGNIIRKEDKVIYSWNRDHATEDNIFTVEEIKENPLTKGVYLYVRTSKKELSRLKRTECLKYETPSIQTNTVPENSTPAPETTQHKYEDGPLPSINIEEELRKIRGEMTEEEINNIYISRDPDEVACRKIAYFIIKNLPEINSGLIKKTIGKLIEANKGELARYQCKNQADLIASFSEKNYEFEEFEDGGWICLKRGKNLYPFPFNLPTRESVGIVKRLFNMERYIGDSSAVAVVQKAATLVEDAKGYDRKEAGDAGVFARSSIPEPKPDTKPEKEESGKFETKLTELPDDSYVEAVEVVLGMGKASASILQKRLRLGYGSAARLLDLMHQEGIIAPPNGSRPREVLINEKQGESYLQSLKKLSVRGEGEPDDKEREEETIPSTPEPTAGSGRESGEELIKKIKIGTNILVAAGTPKKYRAEIIGIPGHNFSPEEWDPNFFYFQMVDGPKNNESFAVSPEILKQELELGEIEIIDSEETIPSTPAQPREGTRNTENRKSKPNERGETFHIDQRVWYKNNAGVVNECVVVSLDNNPDFVKIYYFVGSEQQDRIVKIDNLSHRKETFQTRRTLSPEDEERLIEINTREKAAGMADPLYSRTVEMVFDSDQTDFVPSEVIRKLMGTPTITEEDEYRMKNIVRAMIAEMILELPQSGKIEVSQLAKFKKVELREGEKREYLERLGEIFENREVRYDLFDYRLEQIKKELGEIEEQLEGQDKNPSTAKESFFARIGKKVFDYLFNK